MTSITSTQLERLYFGMSMQTFLILQTTKLPM